MIRWKYVAPRIGLLLLVLLTVWMVKNPVLRWTLIHAGQTVTGAKVDLAQVHSSVLAGELRLTGIQLANPRDTSKNLFQADVASLDLDMRQLLRRKFVVQDGLLSGLQFNTPRSTSGEIQPGTHRHGGGLSLSEWSPEVFARLNSVRDLFARRALDQFETTHVAREILNRWPRDYAQLRQKADALEQKIRRLRSVASQPDDNPLRRVNELQQISHDLQTLPNQLNDIHQHLKRLHDQVPLDRDALQAAQRRDQQRIRNLAQWVHIDGDSIAEILLGQQQADRVQETLRWIRWVQDLVPSENDLLKPQRRQGVDVRFADQQRVPDFLIQQIAIAGTGELAGQTYALRGTARGLTSQPRIYGKPAEVTLHAEGANLVRVQATIDRTTPVAQDTFTITSPSLMLPEQILGTRDSFVVKTQPCESEVHVELMVRGDELTGQLVYHQRGIQLDVVHVADQLGGAPFRQALARTAHQIRNFQVRLNLSGQLADPKWRLETDLGHQLAGAFNRAVEQVAANQIQQLESDLNRQTNHHLDELQHLVGGLDRQMVTQLQGFETEIADIRNRIANQLGFPILR